VNVSISGKTTTIKSCFKSVIAIGCQPHAKCLAKHMEILIKTSKCPCVLMSTPTQYIWVAYLKIWC